MKLISLILFVGAFCLSSLVNADLSHGLTAHYSFDGNSNDSSNNRNDGIVFGDISYVNGANNKAIKISAEGSYVEISSNDAINLNSQFKSISVWFKADNILNENNLIFDKTAASDYLLNIHKTSDRKDLVFSVYNGSEYVLIKTPISTEKWHNVIIIKNNIDIYLYLDTTLIDTITVNTVRTLSNSLIVGAGGSPYDPGYHFSGLIDDLRIYNRVLDNSEIQKLYLYDGNSCKAVNDTVTTVQNTIAITPNVLLNDTDANNNILSISTFDDKSNNGSTITSNMDGTFTYTPLIDFIGEDSFSYALTNRKGCKNIGLVTVKVNKKIPSKSGGGSFTLYGVIGLLLLSFLFTRKRKES